MLESTTLKHCVFRWFEFKHLYCQLSISLSFSNILVKFAHKGPCTDLARVLGKGLSKGLDKVCTRLQVTVWGRFRIVFVEG